MIELLAIPSWVCPKTTVKTWVDQLEAQGLIVTLRAEKGGETWIEVGSLRLLGYALTQGETLEALNFELHANDPAPARAALDVAAQALSWEIHDEPDDEEDDDPS